MGEIVAAMPQVFWIFAGIALIILASGYVKNIGKTSDNNNEEIAQLKKRLDVIEQHLDLRN